MIREVKVYVCPEGQPLDDDIKQALEIVKDQPFIIELKWFVNYSGWYNVSIKDGMTLDEIKDKFPKYYAI